MNTFKNLTIIGTSHIAVQSIEEVKKTIEKLHPDVIALELDIIRFKKLLSKNQKINLWKNIGTQGFLLNLIGAWAEKKLGEKKESGAKNLKISKTTIQKQNENWGLLLIPIHYKWVSLDVRRIEKVDGKVCTEKQYPITSSHTLDDFKLNPSHTLTRFFLFLPRRPRRIGGQMTINKELILAKCPLLPAPWVAVWPQ